ncbi:ADAMTS-like protein 3 [Periophthalmus magnuspinnatus]|uniref:ADAMTS-like protein 3 n=1 Tax=Periophthalmus magnuspinnatus TaxID=409849 RepID=UPI002436657C|nr:ADAMTS-like protein 3 [Periophthalmus magnuspinnatus]
MEALHVWRAVVLMQMFITVQAAGGQTQGSAEFLPEFGLSPLGSLPDDSPEDQSPTSRHDDQVSRFTRSDVLDAASSRDGGWDAWGSWSDCSRTCGGGASYSLRRCLDSGNCDGRNIRYRTCSTADCPLEAGDFRAQQCSAHNDVKLDGVSHEWVAAPYDPSAPCALRCRAKGGTLTVELAPKVLDGTRCRDDAPDMCINGVCQEVGCDRQLGSRVKEDNCGVCGGDGSTCRLVRGQASVHLSPPGPAVKSVVEVPMGSRFLRVSTKGPATMIIEWASDRGRREEAALASSGSFSLGNTSLDFQSGVDRQTLKSQSPLGSDYIIKMKYGGPEDTVVQFLFYQPIRFQWRETDFFPCSITCGGGYQLNSAECVDIRTNQSVPEEHCTSFTENTKPTPRLRECSPDPCPDSDGFKEVMLYDHYQPLPRWESGPWTRCSVSCGDSGGWQDRSVQCVEEDTRGQLSPLEDWRCGHSPRPITRQICNAFACPQWVAMEWSQCTVTCGRGLRYRVVLCIDHRGQHVGGCDSSTKPHVKEETCLVPIACHKPREPVPVEEKEAWSKQAQGLEEPHVATEEPTFVPGPWSRCSAPCGPGVQTRELKCQVLLFFTKTEVDLPEEECGGERPQRQRACTLGPCSRTGASQGPLHPRTELHTWDYRGFSDCSASCATGKQSAVVKCVDHTLDTEVDDSLCDASSKPPALTRTCSPQPCPPRWEVSEWTSCSSSCGVGIQTRTVFCMRLVSVDLGDVLTVSEDQCRDMKPPVLRPCNQHDCPPAWDTGPWEQCSQSCGGGLQFRKVFCKQLLSTGAYRTARGCGDDAPNSTRSCANTDCAPYISGGEWSRCSVSCGLGVQRREPQCLQLSSSAQVLSLSWDKCSGLSSPPLIRACRMMPCPKPKKVMQLSYPPHSQVKRCPFIQSRHAVYVQTRHVRRLQLTIGGHSYLLPRTSLIVRCPVKKFPKASVVWYKDRTRINGSVWINRSGALKIQHLGPEHVGVYRCEAGPASEIFTLQLIGPDSRTRVKAPSPSPRPPSPSWDDFRLSCRTHWTHWSWVSVPVVLLPPGVQDVSLQPQVKDRLIKITLHADANKLRTERAADEAAKLIASMLTDTPPSLVWRRTADEPPSISVSLRNITCREVVLGRSVRATVGATVSVHQGANLTLDCPASESSSNWSESSTVELVLGKPLIVRPQRRVPWILQKNLNISIGQNALLTNTTRSLTLLCPARGLPRPKVVWSKDGSLLRRNSRVRWDSDVLRIVQPRASDQGQYKCICSNVHGSDSETSLLRAAEPPSISVSWRNITDRGVVLGRSVRATVGATVSVQQGANLTLDCPASGVPEPAVTWLRRGRPLPLGAVPLPSGSLWIINVSVSDLGVYSCLANNSIGKAIASTALQVETPPPAHVSESFGSESFGSESFGSESFGSESFGSESFGSESFGSESFGSRSRSVASQELNQRRLLMASSRGTSVHVRPGEVLRIGCPVVPHHSIPVRWSFNNQSLEEGPHQTHHTPTSAPRYRVLAGGRALEVSTVQVQFSGRYQCETVLSAGRQPLTAWIYVHAQEYGWRLGDWTTCSESCGGGGTRLRRVSCVSVLGKDAPLSMCRHRPKPLSSPVPCNAQDCPPRWVVSDWSKCSSSSSSSSSCGAGLKHRQVVCQQLDARGSTRTLPSRSCDEPRPEQTHNCTAHNCPVWVTGPWGKCSGRCLSPSSTVQKRSVLCQHLNGTAHSDCDQSSRPPAVRDCSSDLCSVQWRPGPWGGCSAPCGGGFRSRRVDCVHLRTGRTLAQQHCAWIQRPPTWQPCSSDSSDCTAQSDCTHSSQFCSVAWRLLCHSLVYKHRCCSSCSQRVDSP